MNENNNYNNYINKKSVIQEKLSISIQKNDYNSGKMINDK